jgi:hypothetical protein
VRGKGLFHLSDEWYSGGYQTYSKFDFVLRNYHSKLFVNDAIKTVPLGPGNGMMNPLPVKPAIERRFTWAFAGQQTAPRLAMFNEFKNLGPYECRFSNSRKYQPPPLDKNAFTSLLGDTIFSPCPMGNVLLETFRLYESLEMGCIPLIERRRWLPYFDALMPGHPIPTFATWRAARCFVDAMLKNKSELANCQNIIGQWWRVYKMLLRKEVTSFVVQGMEGSFRTFLMKDWQVQNGLKFEAWRLLELLKHANRSSLQGRLAITVRRIIDRIGTIS